MTAESTVQPELQLRDFIRILKRRKGIIWASLILCVAAAVLYAMMATPTYRSTARILVDARSQQNPQIDNDPVNVYAPGQMAPDIESQIGVLQSPILLTQVFQRAGVTIPSQDDLDSNVIQVKQLGSSNIVDVQVNLPSKEDAYKVATEIPKAYGEYMASSRQGQVRRLLQYTEERFNGEKDALRKANEALIAFNDQEARAGNIVAVAGSKEDEEREFRLRQASFELNAAIARRDGDQQKAESLKAAMKNLPATRDDKAVGSMAEARSAQRSRMSALLEHLNSLKATKADDHPDVLAAAAEYRQAKAYYESMPTAEKRGTQVRNPEIETYQRSYNEAIATVRGDDAQVASLRRTMAEEQKNLATYSKKQARRSELQREVDLRTQTVASSSKMLDDLRMRTNSVKEPLTPLMVSSAEQISPRFIRSIIIGIFLGTVLGVVAAMIRDRTDDRVYTLDQIQESCGILALGRVPQAERVLALVPGTERRQSTALESYRSLRFSLDSNKEGFVESVVLTSATAAEGRAELAYNVAVEAARDLRRTILIDADLRKPTLHGLVGVPETPGLSDYLSGRATLDEILHTTLNNYLTFIPAGSPAENPLQLLTSPAMATLHAELQKRADAIVFNSPSLLRYADGRAIAKVANSAILVAKKGVSKRNALRYCAEMLRRTNTKLLGVVLNDSAASSTDVPYFYSAEEASA